MRSSRNFLATSTAAAMKTSGTAWTSRSEIRAEHSGDRDDASGDADEADDRAKQGEGRKRHGEHHDRSFEGCWWSPLELYAAYLAAESRCCPNNGARESSCDRYPSVSFRAS